MPATITMPLISPDDVYYWSQQNMVQGNATPAFGNFQQPPPASNGFPPTNNPQQSQHQFYASFNSPQPPHSYSSSSSPPSFPYPPQNNSYRQEPENSLPPYNVGPPAHYSSFQTSPSAFNNQVKSPELPPPATLLDQLQLLQICLNYFNYHKESRQLLIFPDERLFFLLTKYIPLYAPLANAIASLSAKRFSHTEPTYLQAAVDFKIKALNSLRQDLAYNGMSEYSIICMLTLGNIEINEMNLEAWTQHLDSAASGVTEILAKNNVFQSSGIHRNFLILLDAFALQDIMFGLAVCTRPRLNKVYHKQWKAFKGDADDNYNGMRESMAHFSEITCLAAELQECHPSISYLVGFKYFQYYCVDRKYYTPRQLETYSRLVSEIYNFQPPESLSGDALSSLMMCRCALEIYLALRFDASEFSLVLSPRLLHAKRQAFYWLNRLPISTSIAVFQFVIIWLFGLVSDTEVDRATVLNKLRTFQLKCARASSYAVMNFLTLLWKMRDSPEYKGHPYRDLLSLVTEQTGFVLMV